MQLDLILRGQSNAALLAEHDGYAGLGTIVAEVERLLGFDGVNDTVRIVYDRDEKGGDTAYPATAFLGDWMQRQEDGSWAAGELETAFLSRLRDDAAEGMGDASAILWLHSEYDSRDPDLSAADWTAAVRTDAALVRATLGRDVPYLFVAAHPYAEGTDAGHQAIRHGMEQLAGDPAFGARIAARAPDLDVSNDDRDGDHTTTDYGGAHITAEDAQLIAKRAAAVVAEQWAAYARPGSPVAEAGGNIPSTGPQAVAAGSVGEGSVQVDTALDGAALAALSEGAASGLGWSLYQPDGRLVQAVGAAVLDADSLVVDFAEPVQPGAVIHYGWGQGRTAAEGGPGQGNAALDEAGFPVWTPAGGIAVDGVW